jgi:RNA polymerase primary sigma factor
MAGAFKALPAARGSAEFDELATFVKAARQFPPLEREAEVKLARKARRGDRRAREALVHHNLALVLAVARRYAMRGIRFDDLVQEGNIGLLKAVEHFDPRRGTRFSTYALWWIRAYIMKIVRDGRGVVRPPPPKPGEDLPLSPRDLSLEESVDDDGEVTHLERLVADDPGPETRLLRSDKRREVNAALVRVKGRLGGLAWDIVQQRLGQDNPKTLEEIGKRWGVSRERVRQVEKGTRQFLRRYLAELLAA